MKKENGKIILEVGDLISVTHYDKLTRIIKIDRVTPKYAFAGNIKFSIEQHEDQKYIYDLPRQSWPTLHYSIATIEHVRKLNLQKLIKEIREKVNALDFANTSFEKAAEILRLIKE